MNDYLLRYAIDNVWCNPGQDRQFVYKLMQLTPKYGTRRVFTVDAMRYELPYESAQEWFHLYQIGQVVPANLGLPKVYNKWISLEKLANEEKMLGEVYVDNGIQFARSQTWVLLTSNQNLLVAVKILPRFPDLDVHQPYLHFYQNAYFQSARSVQADRTFITARSINPKSQGELRQFQVANMDYLEEVGGIPLCWVNGRFVEDISLVNADIGDICEWVLDSSIYRVGKFKLSELPTFNSTLDKLRKYILHTPKAIPFDTIEYFDDVATFLCNDNETFNRFSGVYYHHNDGRWMRQLTHRDYSIPVSRTEQLIAEHPADQREESRFHPDIWSPNDPMYIRAYFRRTGYHRPVVADVSRIEDLYLLKDADIIQAMTGPSSIPIWQAANLEQAGYVKFMSAKPSVIYPIGFNIPSVTNSGKQIAQNFAGDVFGYHECAHLLAFNPARTFLEQGVNSVELAYCYWENSTIFEYDAKGLLLEYHHHVAGSRYYPENPKCVMVEAIVGVGSNDLKGVYGLNPVTIAGGYDFRVYVKAVGDSGIAGEWKDITLLENRHEWGFLDTTGPVPIFRWTASPAEWTGLIRKSDRFFLEERRFSKIDGMIRFSFRHQTMASGQLTGALIDIPFGQLDLFVNPGNGFRALAEGIDYVMIPGKTAAETQVVVCNLEYIGDVNTFLIRGTGFCSPELTMYAPTETGFVEYGVLSGNGIYDLHKHKMQRIIVDGYYRATEDVIFSEANGDAIMTDVRNGAPYQIQTPQITFRDVFDPDEAARILDDERDRQVSGFLTEYFPQRVHPEVDIVTDRYNVFSVYTNKILHDILHGVLVPPVVGGRMLDQDINRITRQYAWLQPFDMLNRDHNKNHIYVYPHWYPEPVGLTALQYELFTRVLRMNMWVMPELSPFIYITRT